MWEFLLGIWFGGFLMGLTWQVNDNVDSIMGCYTPTFEMLWTSATWPLFIIYAWYTFLK